MISGESEAKTVDVRFADGRGALNAYWGFLSDGGLVIEEPDALVEGELVALNVHIESSRSQHRVCGRVVRCHPRRRQAVVAFDAGESGRFLYAALADNAVDVVAHLRSESEPPSASTVRILTVSPEGCCLRLDFEHAAAFPVGARVVIESAAFRLCGCVVWSLGNERGVMFSLEDDALGQRTLSAFLASLSR